MDFMNFSQMILNGGTFNGLTILQPETVSLMYQNAVPAQAMPIGDRGYWLGSGWTLGGFNLVMDASAYSFPVSEGTIWWDGSAATRFFVDPKQDTVIVIMGQVSPSSGGGFREDFSRFVDQAIIERINIYDKQLRLTRAGEYSFGQADESGIRISCRSPGSNLSGSQMVENCLG
jgi:CubicO group peptidase (beta-lactamase class C family)